MRTPLKFSYGKRKRHSHSADLSWDETIDTTPGDSFTVSSALAARTPRDNLSQVLHLKAIAPTSSIFSMMASIPRKPTSEKDIFDFDDQERITKSKFQPLEEEQEASKNQASATEHTTKIIAQEQIKQSRRQTKTLPVRKSPRKAPASLQAPQLHELNPVALSYGKGDKGKGKSAELSEPSIADAEQQSSSQAQFENDIALAIQISREGDQAIGFGTSKSRGHAPSSHGSTFRLHNVEADGPSKRGSERTANLPNQRDQYNEVNGKLAKSVAVAGKSSTFLAFDASDGEIDLEPPARTQTPYIHMGNLSHIPQPSPQKHDISSLFDSKIANTLRLDTRPRRLLHALKSSRNIKNKEQNDVREVPDSEDDVNNLEKLLESAENNLYGQSQQDGCLEQRMPVDSSDTAILQEPLRKDEPLPQSTRSTYSKQRSFLVDVATGDFDDDLLVPATATPVVETDSDASDVEGTSVSIKNLHELRQGGENKRFIGEASYLLEGLDSGETMQSTLIELAHKLSSRDFARRFRAADLDETIWKSCKKVHDPVSIFVLMVILTVLFQHLDHAKLSKNQSYILKRAMDYEKDVSDYVTSKSIKMSKMSKASILELRSEVAKSDAFSGSTETSRLSPRLLALIGLNLCCQNGLDAHEFSSTVLGTVPAHYADLTPVLAEIQMTATILEHLNSDVLAQASREKLEALVQLVVALCAIKSSTSPCKSLALCSFFRCFINLVNNKSRWTALLCHATFLQPLLDYVPQSCTNKSAEEPPDELALCLGLLICLAEESVNAQALMREKVNKNNLLEVMHGALLEANWKSVGGFIALLHFHLFRDRLTSSLAKESDEQAKLSVKHGLRCLQDSIELDSDNVFRKNLQSFSDSIFL